MSSQKSDLDKKFQNYKGRVVLRGDIARDDSGNYAVFTEQGASASHMTAPECSGKESDAVTAYAQVETKGAPDFV